MCGIVGILDFENVTKNLLQGLKSLEYRGYDSAGIATIKNEEINCIKALGKVEVLEKLADRSNINGNNGIGHTRWATHGIPSQENAHPHFTPKVAVVHNGIIENFAFLKENLIKKGCSFKSSTDTEVITQILDQHISEGLSPKEAILKTVSMLEGNFAIAVIFKDFPNTLIGARKGSPLAFSCTSDKFFLGSDAIAIANWAKDICFLEDKDIVIANKTDQKIVYELLDFSGNSVQRKTSKIPIMSSDTSKNGYEHFMLKEIFEQPSTIKNNLEKFLNDKKQVCFGFEIDFEKIEKIYIIACGTSYYAGMVAKYWIEDLSNISVEIDIASEFRYRTNVISEKTLFICLSQSGETIDTLGALQKAKESGCKTLAIVNVDESSIARTADYKIITKCGAEIGVASTKSFTAQLLVMLMFAINIKNSRKDLINQILDLPEIISKELHNLQNIEQIAKFFADKNAALYIGRGTNYPLALEGALKLKEVSYMHAQGYAAGELKHGPIALVDENLPVIAICPSDNWFEKTISNIQEIASRNAKLIILTDAKGKERMIQDVSWTQKPDYIVSNFSNTFIAPIIASIGMQLIAYHVAIVKGNDVDYPRNLAKSVTVE
jgi:glutamine---fructose-6-phosphate transaminase (isomerizing)